MRNWGSQLFALIGGLLTISTLTLLQDSDRWHYYPNIFATIFMPKISIICAIIFSFIYLQNEATRHTR